MCHSRLFFKLLYSSSSWIYRTSFPDSKRCVAQECCNQCKVTDIDIFAFSIACLAPKETGNVAWATLTLADSGSDRLRWDDSCTGRHRPLSLVYRISSQRPFFNNRLQNILSLIFLGTSDVYEFPTRANASKKCIEWIAAGLWCECGVPGYSHFVAANVL